jgi:hypothetical protein
LLLVSSSQQQAYAGGENVESVYTTAKNCTPEEYPRVFAHVCYKVHITVIPGAYCRQEHAHSTHSPVPPAARPAGLATTYVNATMSFICLVSFIGIVRFSNQNARRCIAGVKYATHRHLGDSKAPQALDESIGSRRSARAAFSGRAETTNPSTHQSSRASQPSVISQALALTRERAVRVARSGSFFKRVSKVQYSKV